MNCVQCDSPIPPDSTFCLECGTDLSDPGGGPRTAEMRPDLEERLKRILEGKYRVEKPLGRGGMGAVFLAQDLTLDRPVAIKVLPPELSFDENLVGRFEREARTSAKLDHPNIVSIFSVESSDDLHYFVMKYVAGQSLESVLAGGALPVGRCQEYLWEAARGLGHAHQRGVVHRDVKPANIMLDHDGRIMLADFGISKAMQSATQYTGTGQVIGTPFYMSPEQAKGEQVDGRSDQYSLAVVGYQMITGRLPFGEDSVHALIYKQIFEDPEPIEDLRPDVPPFLAAVLHKALAKKAEERYPTMEDFASAILPERRVTAPAAQAYVSEPVSPDAPTTLTPTTGQTFVTPTQSPAPKRRSGRAAVAAALFVIAGGSGYWAWQQGMIAGLSPSAAGDSGTVLQTTAGTEEAVAAASTSDSQQGGTTEALPRRETETPVQEPPPPTAESRPVRQGPSSRGRARQGPPGSGQARPQLGRLTVGSDPWGAVLIDGVEVTDQTPLANHEIAAGVHEVRVVRDGCITTVDTVTITVGGRPTRLRKNLVCGS